MRRTTPEAELLDLRSTCHTLQCALDAANQRIRDDARVIGELNARLAEQTERRDAAEIALSLFERQQDDAFARAMLETGATA